MIRSTLMTSMLVLLAAPAVLLAGSEGQLNALEGYNSPSGSHDQPALLEERVAQPFEIEEWEGDGPQEDDEDERASSTAATNTTYYHVINGATGTEMAVIYGATVDQALLTLWGVNNFTNQHFSFYNMGNGYYQIKARHTGKCVQPAGGARYDGVPLVQVTCSSSSAQQWKLVPVGSNYLLQSKLDTTACIHPSNYGYTTMVNGTALDLVRCGTTSTSLQWRLSVAP